MSRFLKSVSRVATSVTSNRLAVSSVPKLNLSSSWNALSFQNNAKNFISATRTYSSSADQEFTRFLSDEVHAEKENQLDIPSFSGGWKVERRGPDCIISKSAGGDNITVSFNVNNSVPPFESEDPDEVDDVRAEPDFMVDVKRSSKVCTFDCYFPSNESDHEAEYEEQEDTFCIRAMTMHDGEITDTSFSMETEHFETEMYKHCLKFLTSRGIDNVFADELVQYATAVENSCYVKSLEELQDFIRN